MKRIAIIFLLLVFGREAVAQIPKLGNDTLLDIATWNVEWFGDPSYGPTNENLQYNNVKNLIEQADVDVVALQEVSNYNTYFTLGEYLYPNYGAVTSTFAATQKMSFLYKQSMFEKIDALTKNILTQYSSVPFATRPPLQIALKTKGGNITDTLFFIVVHLKAHTGSTAAKAEAYQKRKDAANMLINYIEQDLAGKKCIILGDWNDDLNTSIYNNSPSPFKQIQDNGYFFPTRQLTDAGKKSYAFGTKMIDHILLNDSAKPYYITASSKVFDNAGSYISNFSQTTSDHFPVYAFLNWKKLTQKPMPPVTGIEAVKEIGISIYPNPATNYITINEATPLSMFSIEGKELFASSTPIKKIDVSSFPRGVYYIKVQGNAGSSSITKFIKQ